MGKSNFPAIYQGIKSQLGTITCKISYFSDDFDPNKNYAGIIVYGVKGKAIWKNDKGQVRGYDGKALYIIILDTKIFPPDRSAGHGRVHHYPLERVLGYDIGQKSDILCGGFSYHQGRLKFSSTWLNMSEQLGFDGSYVASDGSKEMSQAEKVLVRFCWDEYKKRGRHAIFNIPDDIEARIVGLNNGKPALVMGNSGKNSSGGQSFDKNSLGGQSFDKNSLGGQSFDKNSLGGQSFDKISLGGQSVDKNSLGGQSLVEPEPSTRSSSILSDYYPD